MKILIAFFILLNSFGAFAQPIVDGTISSNEYGDHTEGKNQMTVGDDSRYFVTWDDTYLYFAGQRTVADNGYSTKGDAIQIFLDFTANEPVNEGAGTRICPSYDGRDGSLPFKYDAMVAAKAQRALAAGITPIVCVGENLAEREAGQTEAVVKRQLAAVIQANGHCISEIVVAYEPVWAIGTGLTASPEQAQQVHAVLRTQLLAASSHADRVAVLYGGSMTAHNAAELLAQPDVDGGLIGGASLKAPDFLSLLKAASR